MALNVAESNWTGKLHNKVAEGSFQLLSLTKAEQLECQVRCALTSRLTHDKDVNRYHKDCKCAA